eukprot:CAMPEP_0184487032 /NCGR_PEP_ID=MMETSP0113_2-20130426/9029_1 /TAXON_ID=91329 /ORGANISM="Norrisiella sphaerica, Strain BC52" /LENGTH=464 /DNA_ID=CAMNT_0026869175 /DNA_START=155 /DNA_END=1549 /DNA_ORIENTATION=-
MPLMDPLSMSSPSLPGEGKGDGKKHETHNGILNDFLPAGFENKGLNQNTSVPKISHDILSGMNPPKPMVSESGFLKKDDEGRGAEHKASDTSSVGATMSGDDEKKIVPLPKPSTPILNELGHNEFSFENAKPHMQSNAAISSTQSQQLESKGPALKEAGATGHEPLQIPSGAPFSSFLNNGDLAAQMSYNLSGNTAAHNQLMQQTQRIIHDSLASSPGAGFSSLASAPAALGDLRDLLLPQHTDNRLSVRTTVSGSKRKKKVLSEREILIRRQKHKKVEDRRRKRISNLLKKLAEACGCPGADKASILQNALNRIEQVNSQQQQQQQHPGGVQGMMQQLGKGQTSQSQKMQALSPLSSMEESAIVTKPLTLLDTKRMLLLSNFSFRKLFKVENQGYINLLSLVEGVDVLDLQKRLVRCQKGEMESFYQDVRVNIGGEMHIARMFTSMLVSRWHFITLWTIVGKM